jgi:23S rRNA pseudouridine1911/1915/1917 synthase
VGDSATITHLVVPDDRAGLRLDLFLVGLLPAQSRSSVQRLIREGHVRIAGRAEAKPNTPVRAGEQIAVEIAPPVPSTPSAEPLPLAILYEDADLVVVNKAAGMVVHPGAGHARGTLVNALLHHVEDLSGVGGEERPGIVHRLDRGTSGLLVAAKHDIAHRALVREFQDREVEKEYVALVWGLVHRGRRIDAPIGRDPRDRQKMSTRSGRGRPAVTRVTAAEDLGGVSLLHLAIDTGRTHQIRVHLSSIGHPVVGDPVYGGVRAHMPARLRPVTRLERPFLHAARLAFTHPKTGAKMEFEAPLPDDLQGVLEGLREWRK